MKYEVVRYPDGGYYIKILEPFTRLVYRINSYEDLFILRSIKDANPDFTEVYIPCMFQQQHDRRFKSGESFELKLVCEFINSCGFSKVQIFHPHSDVTPALINNCEVMVNFSFVYTVLLQIYGSQSIAEERCVLMSTDAGGFKPLMNLAEKLHWQGEVYSATKARKFDGGKSVLTQVIDRQDFGNKDILIIDDLCVFGGTFLGLVSLLKDKGVGDLYCAFSHLTVKNPNPQLETAFKTIFTTDSKYPASDYALKNLNVIQCHQ